MQKSSRRYCHRYGYGNPPGKFEISHYDRNGIASQSYFPQPSPVSQPSLACPSTSVQQSITLDNKISDMSCPWVQMLRF